MIGRSGHAAKDAEQQRRRDAPEDHLVAHVRGRGRRKANDDGVVAGEHDVDHDDLDELVPVRPPPFGRDD